MHKTLLLITFTFIAFFILLFTMATPAFGAVTPGFSSQFSLSGGAPSTAAPLLTVEYNTPAVGLTVSTLDVGASDVGSYFLSGAILDDFKLLYGDWTLTPVETMLTMTGGLILLQFDKPIYDFIQKYEPEVVDKYISPVLSKLGEWPVLLGIAGAMVFVDPELSKEMMLAMLVDAVNTQVLKCLIGMSRPDVTEEPTFIGPTLNDDYKAMPSGHTSATFAVATVLALRYPKYSWLIYSAASLIGVSRITEGQHWPSNIFFGAMVGVASARQVHEHRLDLVVLRLQF